MKKTRFGCFRTILFAALIFSFYIAAWPQGPAQASNNWLAGIPASETGSTTLYFPHIVSDSSWWTGIVLLNIGNSPTNVTAGAYDIHGNLLGTAAIPLAPGEKKVNTAEGLFSGSLPEGSAWLKVTSSASEITGFELFGTHNGQQLAGIPAFSSGSTTLYLPHIAQDNTWWTGIALLNIGSSAADINIIPYNEHGSIAGQALSITLSPGEKVVGTVLNLSGRSLPSGTAWIKVESAGEIIGFELFGTQNGDQLAGIPASGSGVYTLYLPHVASDDSWWTGIGLLNVGNSTASVTVRARKADGNLIKSISFQLAAGEKKVDTAVGLFGGLLPQGTAWLEIASSGSPITAFELFGTHDGLQLVGIPGLRSGSNKLYLPHIAQDDQWWTGIGLVNIGGSNTNVNITAYDTGGSPLGNAPSFSLAPHGKKVDTASGLFGNSLPEGTAWMEVNSSSAPIAGFVLFGSHYTPPSAPSNLSATSGNTQAIISWLPVADATSYNIYWSTTSGVTKSNGTKISSATSPYTHASLTNGTTYYYIVTAVNSSGESVELAQVSATPTAAGTGTRTASGTYTWNSTTGVLTLNWTSSDFTCDGPELGETTTNTGVTITSTTMTWHNPDDPSEIETWTRSSGTANDIVGTWTASDSDTGNSWTVTFNANGTVSVVGNIVQCSQNGGGGGTGTHTASGTYTWNAATGVINWNWTSSDFTCDGPELGADTETGVTITSTTMTWSDMTWTRSSGTANDIVGTWTASDSETGNSWTLTFNADGTVSVVGNIVSCPIS